MFSGQKLSWAERKQKKLFQAGQKKKKRKKESIGIKSSYSISSYDFEYKKSDNVLKLKCS